MDEAEKAWAEYAVGGEHGGSEPVTYRGAFMAGRESLRSRIAALEAAIRDVRVLADECKGQWVPESDPRTFDQGVGALAQDVLAILDSAPSTVLDQVIREAKAEALDGMTTEWGTKIVSEPGVDVGTEDYARRNVATWNQSGYHKGDMRGVVVSRLVGPWTPVEGDA